MATDPNRKGVGASASTPGSGVPHGTHSGYSWHKCRCEECVAFKRTINRADYAKNREKIKARTRAYAAANPQRRRDSSRAYRERRGEELLAEKREYARKNSAAEKARVREWRKQPHAKVARRLEAHNRRQAPFDAEAREYAAILLNDPCSYCGGPGGTIDHIVPVSAGGTSHWSNLTAACHSCNSRKHNIPLLHFLLRRLSERPTTPGHSAAA